MELYLLKFVVLLLAYGIEIDAYLKEPCRDVAAESTCWLMLNNGRCGKDPRMKVYCKKTCGYCYACEDQLVKEKCDELATLGACLQNHQKMKNLCPQTCGFCPKNCRDKYAACKKLKNHQACSTHPDRMRDLCPESCGHCKPSTACDDFFCPTGFSCNLRSNGTAHCVCNIDCSKIAQTGPICSKAGKTYAHLCALKKEECETLSFVPVNHYGSCKTPINTCVDESRESKAGLCEEWKANGACVDHIAVMKTFCKKTCGLCRVPRNPPKPKCLDTEFGCCWNGKDVAKKGKYGEGCAPCDDLRFCEAFQAFCGSKKSHAIMKKYCPFKCGYCLPEHRHRILDHEMQMYRAQNNLRKR